MSNEILTIHCQECLKLDESCKGKTNGELQAQYGTAFNGTKWTCSAFVFNPALLDDVEDNFVSEQTKLTEILKEIELDDAGQDEHQNKPAISVPVGTETRQSAFARLSEKRLAAVLEKMRILENLTDNYVRKDGSKRYVYDFTPGDADYIIRKLQDSIDKLKKLFAK
jgi:hypothetical protein